MANTKIIIGDDTVQTLLLQEKDSLILQDKLISLYPYDEETTDPFPVNCRKLQNVFGDKMLSRVWMNYALSKVALVENTDYVKRTFENNPFDTVIYLTVSAAQKLATAHNNKSLGLLVKTYLSWAVEQQRRAAAEASLSLTQEDISSSPFDAIRHYDESGNEYWSARELQGLLGYKQWRQFEDTVERAKVACANTGISEDGVLTRFADARKMVDQGSGAQREVKDYRLDRYACYLTAMNGDPRKPEIAAAQTYFAVKTRQAETQQPIATLDNKSLTLLNETMTTVKVFVEQQAAIRDDVNDLQDRVTKLEEEKRYLSVVKETDSYDPVTANGNISVGDMAVILQERGFDTGRQRLFDWLVKNKMIRKLKKGYVPFKKFIDLGLLSSEESEYETPAGITVPYIKLLVTPKGKQYILERFTILASAS